MLRKLLQACLKHPFAAAYVVLVLAVGAAENRAKRGRQPNRGRFRSE
jgi:hypothetical protein